MKGVFTFARILFFGLLTGAVPVLGADRPIVLTRAQEALILRHSVSYFQDSTHSLTLADIQKAAYTARFIPFPDVKMPDLGSTASAIWMRFTVINQTRKEWALEISNPLLEEVVFYKTANGKLLDERHAGFFYPKAKRDVESNFYIFSLFDPDRPSPDTLTCYIRVVNSMPMQFPMQIATIHSLYEENHPIDVANGIYIGIVGVMILYNLFLYASVRDKTYVFYVAYVFFSGIVIVDFQGYFFDLVWRHSFMDWLPVIDYVPVMLANVFGVLFAWHFLDTPTHTPRMHKGIRILLASSVGVMLLGAIGTVFQLNRYKVWCEIAIQAVVFCSSMYMLGVGTLLLSRKKRPALFYVLAWTIFLISTAIFILQIDGFLPNNFLTEHAIQIGSAIETLLLSLALADRINIYKRERENAQSQYIAQLQENEQVRTRIARDLHDDIGSTLSSIAILSQVAKQQSQKAVTPTEILEKISNSAQKMMDSMHDIVWTTQPANDSLNSVAVRMREFAAEVLEAKNIHYQIQVDESLLDVKLPTKRHYDFYMIFKEAINNAAKYSEATKLLVQVHRMNGSLNLQIRDNGIGFNQNTEKSGNGLKNMHKRAQQLEGELHIYSKPGEGTFIKVTLPITQ